MTPFYGRLPSVPGFGVDVTAEQIGLSVIGGVAALTAAHAVGSAIRQSRTKKGAALATPEALSEDMVAGASAAGSDGLISGAEGTKQP